MTIRKLLLLALALYTFIAPFTYHPDTKLNLYYAALGGGKVFDIYSYLEKNKLDIANLHYPPLHFAFVKVEFALSSLIGGPGFTQWLHADSSAAVRDPHIFQYNLASKLPLILLALYSGWLIYLLLFNVTLDTKLSLSGSVFFLFNPITLYAVPLMGQNDIITIALFLTGLLFLLRNFKFQISNFKFEANVILGFIFFGLAASIKNYPLIWAGLVAALLPIKSIYKKILLASIPLVIYLLTIAPFIRSSFFRSEVLGAGLVTRFFDATLPIGFGNSIIITPFLIVLLAGIALFKSSINVSPDLVGTKLRMDPRIKSEDDTLAPNLSLLSTLSSLLLASSFVLLGYSHFHPQWLLWVVPFWAIAYALSKYSNSSHSVRTVNPQRGNYSSSDQREVFPDPIYGISNSITQAHILLSILTSVILFGVILLFDDRFLSWGIFSPLNPNLLNLPTLRFFLESRLVDATFIDNLLHSAVAGLSLVFIWLFANSATFSHSRESGNLYQEISLKKGKSIGIDYRIKSDNDTINPRATYTQDDLKRSLRHRLLLLLPLLLLVLTSCFLLLAFFKALPVVSMYETPIADGPFFTPVKEFISLTQIRTFHLNNVYRLEILFKNPGLASRDEIQVTLRDSTGKSFDTQTVSGLNVGDPSYVRFDFAPRLNAQNQTYQVKIDKLNQTDGLLAYGRDNQALVIREYAKPQLSKTVAGDSLQALFTTLKTQPVIFLFPVASIFLLI